MYLLACQSNFNLSINCMYCWIPFISEYLIGRPNPNRALFANVWQFVTTQRVNCWCKLWVNFKLSSYQWNTPADQQARWKSEASISACFWRFPVPFYLTFSRRCTCTWQHILAHPSGSHNSVHWGSFMAKAAFTSRTMTSASFSCCHMVQAIAGVTFPC